MTRDNDCSFTAKFLDWTFVQINVILSPVIHLTKQTKMAKTRTEITLDSESKRGVKTKGFKLHVDAIQFIQDAAEKLGIPQNELIVMAVQKLMNGLETEQ